MEIKDMQAFYAIVEEGNISHAAQRLESAQPALSRQMKKLEMSLGTKLFERGSRRIRLTEAGRVLYSKIEHILSLVDGTVREIKEVGAGMAGTVRLGTITTSGAMLLPKLIEKYHATYPKVTFQLWEGEGARVLELLNSRVIEIGITRTMVDKNVYNSFVLPDEPLAVMMNKEKCICGSQDDEVRFAALENPPLIVPLRWQPAFVANCHKKGIEPKIVCTSDSILQDLLWTKLGIGMSILPISAGRMMQEENLVCKKLVSPEMKTQTVVAWLKNTSMSTAAKQLLKMFQEMFLQGNYAEK